MPVIVNFKTLPACKWCGLRVDEGWVYPCAFCGQYTCSECVSVKDFRCTHTTPEQRGVVTSQDWK